MRNNCVIGLCRVNLFTLLPLPCSACLGPEIFLLEDTLVWSSEQLTWSKLRLGLVEKFGFGDSQARPKGSVLAPRGLSLVTGSPSCVVCVYTYICVDWVAQSV